MLFLLVDIMIHPAGFAVNAGIIQIGGIFYLPVAAFLHMLLFSLIG